MSTQINIENYESFYLDFLEGNLNESDSAALMEFLEAHPDLIVEDDLVYLPEAEFVALDNQSKLGLKFPDTDQKIGLNNIEIFLIASVEQQLSADKSKELQAFLANNPSYMDELSLYQRSRLQADLSIVFPEKKSLKKGGIIVPMYARFAAAAASVIIAISVFNFGGGDHPTHLASSGKDGKKPLTEKPVQTQKDAQGNEVKTNPGEIVHVIEVESGIQNVGSEPSNLAKNNTVDPVSPVIKNDIPSKPLKYKKAKPVNTSRPVLIEPELAHVPFAAQKEEVVQDGNSFAMVEMKNPIQPITKRISEVLKKDVDFKTTKAARKKSGGFYLKIGKFEVSRKVYDNSSVAVK